MRTRLPEHASLRLIYAIAGHWAEADFSNARHSNGFEGGHSPHFDGRFANACATDPSDQFIGTCVYPEDCNPKERTIEITCGICAALEDKALRGYLPHEKEPEQLGSPLLGWAIDNKL